MRSVLTSLCAAWVTLWVVGCGTQTGDGPADAGDESIGLDAGVGFATAGGARDTDAEDDDIPGIPAEGTHRE